jgi:GDP-L-fucose synthase
MYDIAGKRIWVAGHRGMVGSAVVRRLSSEPIGELVTASSSELDLRLQDETEAFVKAARPDVAIIAAAKVGGIHANRSAQADFLYDNAMIALNALRACHKVEVEKVLVLGSSCIYPAEASQPMQEDALMTGPLEATNEGYAVAKILALKYGAMLRRQYGMDVVSLMPTNLYGPNDNYDLATSHVLPALIRKVHEAKVNQSNEITLWGTGRPRREFLYVDDLADAVVFAARHYSGEQHLNVGTGKDISIAELALLIGETVGWRGESVFDESMPDGTLRKLLDVSMLSSLGWTASTSLREGLARTYDSYLSEHGSRSVPEHGNGTSAGV